MVKAVFDNLDEFKKLHPALGNLMPETETDKCARWLTEYLADGRKDSRDVKLAAEARGYGERVLRDAKDKVGIKPKREGQAGKDQVSWWALPEGGDA